MPELPDLEVIRQFLAPRIVDVPIVSAEVRRPTVVRNLLGGDAVPMGTVGEDFAPYASWMDELGVSRDHVTEVEGTYTAQAFITTDLDDNQITAFHSGAMNRAHEAAVSDVKEDLEAAIVGPNGKQAMIEHARALKERGVATVIDPGQALTQFERDELREFASGATVFVVNDYEWSLSRDRAGWDEAAFRRDLLQPMTYSILARAVFEMAGPRMTTGLCRYLASGDFRHRLLMLQRPSRWRRCLARLVMARWRDLDGCPRLPVVQWCRRRDR